MLASLAVVPSPFAESALLYKATPGVGNAVALGVDAIGNYTVSDSAETISLDRTLIALGWTLDAAGHAASGPLPTTGSPPSQLFSAIAIDTLDGSDTVTLRSTELLTSVSPSAGATLALNLGDAGSVQGINSPVVVDNPSGTTALRVDASADPTGRTATLRAGGSGVLLYGLSPEAVTFSVGQRVSLDVLAGTGADTLTVDSSAGNVIPPNGLTFDGGPGVDTLNLRGGTFSSETVDANGPGAGVIRLGAPYVGFQSLESVNDTVEAGELTFNLPLSARSVAVMDGQAVEGSPTDRIAGGDTPATFGPWNFANKAFVNVNTAMLSQVNPLTATVNVTTAAAGLRRLYVNTGPPDDTVNLISRPPGVGTVIDVGDGNNVVNVAAAGLGTEGGASLVNGGAGNDRLHVDAGGRAVNASVGGGLVVSGTTDLTYRLFESLDVVNAADPPFIPRPGSLFLTRGGTLVDAVIGGFKDADPYARPTRYSVAIDWGDGSPPTAGRTVLRADGGFDVIGSHAYRAAGRFSVRVFVADAPDTAAFTTAGVRVSVSDVGGARTSFFSDVSVAETALTGRGLPVVRTEGEPFAGPVATFTDRDPRSTPASFTAAIDWGDGSAATAGTIGLQGQTFSVGGAHTYANAGTYPVTVTVFDAAPDPESGRFATLGTFRTTATIGRDLVVRNTNDSGRGSLRYVINVVNALGVGGTVRFAIPGPGPHVIRLASPLSPVDVPAVIDGSTQPGFAGTPVVGVDGRALAAGDGLVLQARQGGAGVRSLAVGGFRNGVGVIVRGPGGDLVENNEIGTDIAGAAAVPNYQGVLILGSSRNTVRGNLISGNLSAGVQILDNLNVNDPTVVFAPPPGHATGNTVANNRVGTNAAGTGPLGNQQGVFVNDAAGNSVAGNVVSGNRSIGVQILGLHATGNVVTGNAIGTDLSGTRRLGNSVGVFVYAAPGNAVGPNALAFNTGANSLARNPSAGPEVEGVSFTRDARGDITGAVMAFTTYLDRGRAENPGNYVVTVPGRRSPAVPVGRPVYNGLFRTVTLTFGQAVPAGVVLRLQAVGRGGTGLSDPAGNRLDGASTLPAPPGGSDFLAFYRQGAQVNPSTPAPATPRRTAVHAAVSRPQHPAGRAR